MNPLLNLFLQLQPLPHGMKGHEPITPSPNFEFLHDGRLRSLYSPHRTFFVSEVSIIEVPMPALSVIWYYIATKAGVFIGYAVRSFPVINSII